MTTGLLIAVALTFPVEDVARAPIAAATASAVTVTVPRAIVLDVPPGLTKALSAKTVHVPTYPTASTPPGTIVDVTIVEDVPSLDVAAIPAGATFAEPVMEVIVPMADVVAMPVGVVVALVPKLQPVLPPPSVECVALQDAPPVARLPVRDR